MGIKKKDSLRSRTKRWEIPEWDSRKEYLRVSHCRGDKLEILNQVVDTPGLYSCKYRGVKGGRCGVKDYSCLRRSEIIGLSPLR